MYSKVSYPNFINSIDSSVSFIGVPDNSFNNVKYAILDSSQFKNVQSIKIGSNCFGSVQTFRIDGLNRLKTIMIENNSFIIKRNIYKCDINKSFHILNCESLEFIQIGEYNFTDFAGEFELTNLPQLQSIQIGTIGNNSYNFHGSSFIIHGIELMLYI